MLYYNVIFLRFLILTEFLVIITVLFYIIDNEINRWLFLIFLLLSVCEFCFGFIIITKNKLWELDH